MNHSPNLPEEVRRIEALRDYMGDGTGADPGLDDLTMLAATICATPVALVSLVGRETLTFPSAVGFTDTEAERAGSFCDHAIGGGDLFLVPDAALDERFAGNPRVTGERGIRFYAASQMITPDGQSIGLICVIDHVPRTLSNNQQAALRALSRQAMTLLERARKTRQLQQRESELRDAVRFEQAALDALSARVCVVDSDGVILATNQSWRSALEGFLVEPRNTARGANYLAVCERATGPDKPYAEAFAKGLREVIRGERPEFSLLYPCHTSNLKRWFEGRITRFAGTGPVKAAIAHTDVTERVLVEARTLEVDTRTRLLVKAGNVGLWDWDLRTDEVYYSPEWKRQIGYEDEELPNSFDTWRSRLHPDDRTSVLRCAQELRDGRRPGYEVEFRLRHKDDSWRWILARAEVLRDETGNPIRMMGSHVEITERKRTEEALVRSEANFRLLFDHLPIPVWVEDMSAVKNGLDELKKAGVTDFAAHFSANPALVRELTSKIRVLDVNDAVLRVHRAKTKEALLENLGLVFTESTYNVLKDEFTWLAEGRLEFELEEDVRTVDGEPMRVISRLTVAPGHEETFGLVIVSVLDISERTRIAARLAVREKQYRTLVDNLPAGIVVHAPDGTVRLANPAAARMLGLSPDQILGRSAVDPHWKFLNEDGSDAVPEDHPVQRVLSTGNRIENHMLGIRRPELPLPAWVLCNAYPVRDTQGALAEVVVTFVDITERRRLEQQFLRAQRMESIGTLAGGIAHDLNNVLAPILLSLELLKETHTDKDDGELLATLQSSAQRGANLVRQVLTFARGIEGRAIKINLVHVARELEKIVRDTFPKSIEFRLVAGRDIPIVSGDPTQIHQVLLNLCVNARDAMPEGGRLTLALERAVLDDVYVGMNPAAKAGLYAVAKVSDNGSGIPAAIQERIFEPFFTTKEVGKGTGLGLSTTQAIVKGHGGFIELDSHPGQGTTFRVYFPADPVGTADETAFQALDLPRGHGETILVVDDEESIRTVAEKTLVRFGYRVVLANNGANAVALYALRRAEIAVVLTDMAMPVMDGPSLIGALRAIDPAVRIIGSSGVDSHGTGTGSRTADIRGFVPKPYTAETLLRAISDSLRSP